MPVRAGASAELPTDDQGEIDWVMLASMQSFPASDAPAYPASAGSRSRTPRGEGGHLPRPQASGAPVTIRGILVPLDGSELSRRAIPLAELLADRLGASLTLVTVVETLADIIAQTSAGGPMPAGVAYDRGAIFDDAKRAATEDLDRARSGIRMAADKLVLEGSPARAIVEHARRDNVDLIVMSTRGQGGLARAVLGSVADEVARSAPCPVLLVSHLSAR